MDFEQIHLQTPLEAVAIRTTYNSPTTICSLYLPPSLSLSLSALDSLISQLPPPILLLGDFNAHNPIWGSSHTSPRGTIIEEFLSNHPLTLLNQPSPTFICSSSGSFSSIDLSICSSNISTSFQWDISHDTHGSDHFPIIIRSLIQIPTNITSTEKLNLAKADWPKFSSLVKLPTTPVQDFNLFINQFTNNILIAANNSIPKLHPHHSKLPVPWWSKECARAIRQRKTALNLFKRHPNQEHFINFKKARAQAKRTIKEAKTNSWHSFTSSIKQPISSKLLWRSIKRMKGVNPSFIPSLQDGSSFITDHQDICNTLARHFQSKSVSSSLNSDTHPLSFSFNTSTQHHYNDPFTLLELNIAISQSKKTAPGPDYIHTVMIQHIPSDALKALLNYYNHLWLNSCFPSSWLHSTIIPVHKPGKPRSLPDSYRPISLTNQLCKIMERMVLHRLSWFLEKNNHLSPYQYGFRKHRSAMDHLSSLETNIRSAFNQHHHLGLLSLDLSNAFDTTNRNTILTQLKEMGLEGSLPNFIQGFLTPRTFRVRANGHLSDPLVLSLGVPQGSVLSPTLFNIAILSLTNVIPHHIKYKLFADDIILYYSSPSSSNITVNLQRTLNVLYEWSNSYGYSFSPKKSVFIHFCKKRNCPKLNPLNINGSPISIQNSHNILGLIFDSSLTWNSHINYLRSRTAQDLNLLRLLAHSKWGSDFSSIIIIYKSLILSKLNYGDFIYDSASHSIKKKLDTIQNQALRLATGAFRTSPISSLQCVSSIPPLYLNRQFSLMKFYALSMNRPHFKSSLNLTYLHLSRTISLSSNSIPSRLKHLLTLHNFTPPRFEYPLTTSFPPWQTSSPHIDFSMCTLDREITPNKIINSIFNDKLKNQYSDYFAIYTDGSKSCAGVGAAFIAQNIQKTFKLPLHSSIFSAELLAIRESIRYAITTLPNFKFLIASDSQSALKSIQHANLDDAYIRQINDLLYIARLKNKSFTLIWIPGHCDIEGNDKADTFAKEASLSGAPILGENHPRDYIKHLSQEFRKLFQLQWDLEDTSNKLWDLKTDVYPPLHHQTLNRKENTIVRRLAIGHTYQTHSFLLNKEDSPNCPSCHLPLTVKHIFESRHLSDIREKYHIPSNLKSVIQSYNIIHRQIGEYLKEIHFKV